MSELATTAQASISSDGNGFRIFNLVLLPCLGNVRCDVILRVEHSSATDQRRRKRDEGLRAPSHWSKSHEA